MCYCIWGKHCWNTGHYIKSHVKKLSWKVASEEGLILEETVVSFSMQLCGEFEFGCQESQRQVWSSVVAIILNLTFSISVFFFSWFLCSLLLVWCMFLINKHRTFMFLINNHRVHSKECSRYIHSFKRHAYCVALTWVVILLVALLVAIVITMLILMIKLLRILYFTRV